MRALGALFAIWILLYVGFWAGVLVVTVGIVKWAWSWW